MAVLNCLSAAGGVQLCILTFHHISDLFYSTIRLKSEITSVSDASVYTLFIIITSIIGARGGVVVKALRYKPAGRGFDSRWCQDFSP